MQVKLVIVSGMNIQEDFADYMISEGSSRQQVAQRQQVTNLSIDSMQGVEGMSIKEILEAIQSNEIEMDIQIGCLDDETIYKYQKIKQILNQCELLNGFRNDKYLVLKLFYFENMTVPRIAEELEKSERHIFRLKNDGIEELEKKFLRKAYPPRSGS